MEIFKPQSGTSNGLFILRNGFSGPVVHAVVFCKGDEIPLIGYW